MSHWVECIGLNESSVLFIYHKMSIFPAPETSIFLSNTYQGRGTSQGKTIPIKLHFASFFFFYRIISPLVGFCPPDKYSYVISKRKLIYIYEQRPFGTIYQTTYIIQAPILSIQYLNISIKLQAIYYKICETTLHLSIQLPLQFL